MALVGVALVGLKPRVPGRRMEQSVEEFWSAPETGGKVLLIWFLLEGAGTIAAVGYFLTGAPASAIVMGLATAACWLCGPSQFARG